QAHSGSSAEFASLKSEAAEQTAMLISGLDASAGEVMSKKVSALLDEARALDESEFKSKRAAMEQTAKQIVGHPDPMQSLRHWMEREMADLLSNPQLPAALEARLKAGQ